MDKKTGKRYGEIEMRIESMPRNDYKRLLRMLKEEGRAVVVAGRGGRRVQTWAYETYRTQCDRAKSNKPWLHRQKKTRSILGPIGSQALKVQGNLSRERIYEGR